MVDQFCQVTLSSSSHPNERLSTEAVHAETQSDFHQSISQSTQTEKVDPKAEDSSEIEHCRRHRKQLHELLESLRGANEDRNRQRIQIRVL